MNPWSLASGVSQSLGEKNKRKASQVELQLPDHPIHSRGLLSSYSYNQHPRSSPLQSCSHLTRLREISHSPTQLVNSRSHGVKSTFPTSTPPASPGFPWSGQPINTIVHYVPTLLVMAGARPSDSNPFTDSAAIQDEREAIVESTLSVGRNATLTLGTDAVIVLGSIDLLLLITFRSL